MNESVQILLFYSEYFPEFLDNKRVVMAEIGCFVVYCVCVVFHFISMTKVLFCNCLEGDDQQ